MISNREPGISAAVSLTRATGVEPSWSPTRHKVGASIRPAGGPEVRALQGAASGEIALFRRSREHRADARELGGSLSAEFRGEPALEDGIGDCIDAAALDLSDAPIPSLVGSDLRRRVAEHERGDAIRVLTIKLLRDHAADRKSDDRGPPDAEDLQKRRKVARVVGHLVPVRAGFGEAVAALVVGDDAEIGREDLSDRSPDAQIAAERVDENERRPVASALVG